jgi:ketosteroid isomerase-like protein
MEGVGGLKDMRVGEKGFVSEAEEQNKALVRRFLAAVQKGDSDTMHELLSPDFVDHSLLPGQEPGRDGYIEAVAEDHAAFSNIRFQIEDMVASGDKVITRHTTRHPRPKGVDEHYTRWERMGCHGHSHPPHLWGQDRRGVEREQR